MPKRLSVLLPTILVCCVLICLHIAIFTGYIILIPVFIAGALIGPLTLLYLIYDKQALIFAVLILTALLIAAILAHPIKMRRWAAIITIIGVCIWMRIGYFAIGIVLSIAAA